MEAKNNVFKDGYLVLSNMKPSHQPRVRIARGDWTPQYERPCQNLNFRSFFGHYGPKMALDRCVAYLDEKFARLPDNSESRDVQTVVDEAVSALLGSVAANDARFECQLEPSGSFSELRDQDHSS